MVLDWIFYQSITLRGGSRIERDDINVQKYLRRQSFFKVLPRFKLFVILANTYMLHEKHNFTYIFIYLSIYL